MSATPLQYTHSGKRFLLGYGTDFFGIWDREQADPGPVERFTRDDPGWASAWSRFSSLEPDHVVVGLAGVGRTQGTPANEVAGRSPATGAPASPEIRRTWWLLPLFLGWIGGVIAWFALRRRDPRLAALMFVAGIISNVVGAWLYGRLIPPSG